VVGDLKLLLLKLLNKCALWFAVCTVVVVAVIAVAVMVCGRHGFGRHSPPCGRHGLILGPLSFVAVIAVAVMVCGRHRRSL